MNPAEAPYPDYSSGYSRVTAVSPACHRVRASFAATAKHPRWRCRVTEHHRHMPVLSGMDTPRSSVAITRQSVRAISENSAISLRLPRISAVHSGATRHHSVVSLHSDDASGIRTRMSPGQRDSPRSASRWFYSPTTVCAGVTSRHPSHPPDKTQCLATASDGWGISPLTRQILDSTV